MNETYPDGVIGAFTEDQTARLTGLTIGRLRHWDQTGFFVPSFAAEDRRALFSRIYSFRDLLSLQVLKVLRVDMGCSLQHLREVKKKLDHLGDEKWSRTRLGVLKRKVVFYDEEKGEHREPVSGQVIFDLPLAVVKRNMQDSIKRLSERSEEDLGQIERHRNVRHNAAVIAGTRISVGAVKRLSEDGYSIQRIIEEYPSLTPDDVRAALAFDETKSAA